MVKTIKKIVHNKIFLLLLVILLILSVSFIGTYAWFTWNSQENTTLTMKIGEIADVTFINGNDIDANLTPVFNYFDGEKTTFAIENKNISSNIVLHSVTLNIENIPEELRVESLKYKLIGNNNYIIDGELSDAVNGSEISLVNNLELESGSTEYMFYLYIDGNEENSSDMINKNITANITVTASGAEHTQLSDFAYLLGSESTTYNTINYYGEGSDVNAVGNLARTITIAPNEILLTRYIGESTTVFVPETYTVDGVTYNTVVLSCGTITIGSDTTKIRTGVFLGNSFITDVIFSDNVKTLSYDYSNGDAYKSAAYLFENCTSLINVINIPDDANAMYYAFSGCTSIVDAPVLPSSTTEMTGTFNGCTTLRNVSVLPDSLASMNLTFSGCTSLENVADIPASVNTMLMTFSGCSKLSGEINVRASSVTNAIGIVIGTVLPITVKVPAGTTTYTTFTGVIPSNVTLVGI